MNVSQIIDLIAQISFDDDVPSTADRARILTYINLANNDVYQQVAQIGSAFLSGTSVLTLTDSAVDLPVDFFKSIKVIDITNGTALVAKEVEAIETDEPALNRTGTPEYYYIEGGQLKVYPLQDVQVRLRYTPNLALLADTSDDTQIKYPAQFHQIIADGALYYMFEDERDIRNDSEINRAEVRYTNLKTNLVNYYKSESRQPLVSQGTYF